MITCPGCGRLAHAERLTELAQLAQDASARGDLSQALSYWREALALLPANSRQYQVISGRITDLGKQVPTQLFPTPQSKASNGPKSKLAGIFGAIALTLWKLKTLLLGLSKGTTLLSMLLFMGVYWNAYGWKFAAGMVLSIYVHEMGHVIALNRLGFKATAPMFIPGLGAVIRLQQQVVNPREDAEIGLAGPIYGLGAAIAAYGLWYATHEPVFTAIAGMGAWINLFNLLPVYTLDGGRGFHAMSQPQKLLCALAVGIAWYFTGDGLLAIIGIVCVFRALGDRSEKVGNWRATVIYVFLVASLTALFMARPAGGQGFNAW